MNMIVSKLRQFYMILATESDPHQQANQRLPAGNGETKIGLDDNGTVGWISEAHRLSLGANRSRNRSRVRLIGVVHVRQGRRSGAVNRSSRLHRSMPRDPP
jgi:hypothetical protein